MCVCGGGEVPSHSVDVGRSKEPVGMVGLHGFTDSTSDRVSSTSPVNGLLGPCPPHSVPTGPRDEAGAGVLSHLLSSLNHIGGPQEIIGPPRQLVGHHHPAGEDQSQ